MLRKTETVKEYVYRRRSRKPNASIFWITATSEDNIKLQFQRIAEQLFTAAASSDGSVKASLDLETSKRCPPQQQVEALDVEQPPTAAFIGERYVQGWMIAPGHEDWLLILDNLDDIQFNIRQFLPTGAAGSIIITTRDRRIVGSIASSGISLTAMDFPDAERLFLRLQSLSDGSCWKKPESHPEYSAIQQIIQEMHGFPLAIDQASAFIRENAPMTFQEYLSFLKPRSEDRELLMRFKEANPKYPESVMTTWEISLRHLERTQPRASLIIQLLGFMDHSRVSESLLRAVTKGTTWRFAASYQERRLSAKLQEELIYLKDDVGFRLAIGALTSLSLVKRDTQDRSGPVLSVHPLVHEWIRVRLNSNPAQQAKFSVAATLVLYQTFPFEVITKLYNEPLDEPSEVYSRVDGVLSHTKNVLVNLLEYQPHGDHLPIECFVLCGTLLLACSARHPIYHRTIDSTIVDDIYLIMGTLASQSQDRFGQLVSVIYAALKCLSSPRPSIRKTSRICDILASITLEVPLEDYDATLLILLVTVVTDLSETRYNKDQNLGLLIANRESIKEFDSNIMSDGQQVRGESLKQAEVQQKKTKIQLFSELRRVLSCAPHTSALSQHIVLYVDFHLVGLMTIDEYQAHKNFNIVQNLSSATLSHLAYNEKAAYLCSGAKLLWEHNGYKDFDGLQKLFSLTMKECAATLKKHQRARGEELAEAAMERWSHSSYISSSFGRNDPADGPLQRGEDLITPLDYIWSIILSVTKAISNPKLQWKALSDKEGEPRVLYYSQRLYAPQLLHSATKVYVMVKAQLSRYQVTLLDASRLMEWKTKQAFIEIYTNLENWSAVSNLIQDLLQCKDIVRFCELTHRRLWEPWDSNPDASKRVQRPAPHHVTTGNRTSLKPAWLPRLNKFQKQGMYIKAIAEGRH